MDNGGLLFVNGSGGEVNVYSNGPSQYIHYDNQGFNTPIAFSMSEMPQFILSQVLQFTQVSSSSSNESAVPEPMSIALFGIGLAGLGWVRARKAS